MAVILNNCFRERGGSVAFVECGGLWNGLLSCGRTTEPPQSLRSLRGLASPFDRWSQPVPQPTLAECRLTEPQLS